MTLKATNDDFTGPVNLGSPAEFTIPELTEKFIAVIGFQSKLKFLPPQADDPKQRWPHIALAQSALGWHPVVFKRTIAHSDGLLASARAHTGV